MARTGAADKQQSLAHTNQTIESTLQGLGVQWLRSVDNYDVAAMRRTLEDAFTSDFSARGNITAASGTSITAINPTGVG